MKGIGSEAYPLPQLVRDHPGLITPAERTLLYGLACKHYQGTGVIIDAGTFLGCSAAAFATGLRDGGHVPKDCRPIQSFDIAIWYDSMNRYLEMPAFAGLFPEGRPQQGDSFAPELCRLIAPFADLVDLVIGDISDTPKDDSPVEIAFFDCLKSNRGDLAALRAFAPRYMPGHTVVLQQDYFYEGAPFNKIRQEFFADHFDYLGQTATTAAFLLRIPIPKHQIDADPVAELSLEEQVAFLRQAAGRAQDIKAAIHAELAVVQHLLDNAEIDWARDEILRQAKRIGEIGTDALTRRPEQIIAGFKARLADLTETSGTT